MKRRLWRNAAWLLAMALTGQTPRSGPQISTFASNIDDSEQPYALYIPKDYSAVRKYPLVISLHDAGSNHRLNLLRVFGRRALPGEIDTEEIRGFPALRDVDFVVAAPLARGTMGYQGIAEKDVYDVLADVRRRFSIDDDRIYLTGISMGGGGAMWLSLTRPDVWAAVEAVCPDTPPDAVAFTPNALHLTAAIQQGGADPVVKAADVREFAAKLVKAGAKIEYTEYPLVKHNCWANAYHDGAAFNWFAQFKRERFPDRVHFVTDRYRYSSAFWVRLEQITPGSLARIDARFIAANRLEIVTDLLGAFTLTLKGHPRYSAARPLRVTIDSAAVRVAGKSLTFIRRNGVWVNGAYKPSSTEKHRDAEGPISEAFAERHVYVYGTADVPSADELAARRAVAVKAADWSTPKSHLTLALRVLADRDVKPADLNGANLVLFGSKQTNSIIALLAPGLPLELNAGAADYGLVYIFPNGAHYVVINSGLPWWTGDEHLRTAAMRFPRSIPVYAAAGLGDFMLLKGSVEDIVAEGRFDNQWKLPPEAAAKMRATGAVTIR